MRLDPWWNMNRGKLYRWVETDPVQPEFGEVWYNPESDIIFIRRVTHEFEDLTCQLLEGRSGAPCVLLGEL